MTLDDFDEKIPHFMHEWLFDMTDTTTDGFNWNGLVNKVNIMCDYLDIPPPNMDRVIVRDANQPQWDKLYDNIVSNIDFLEHIFTYIRLCKL